MQRRNLAQSHGLFHTRRELGVFGDDAIERETLFHDETKDVLLLGVPTYFQLWGDLKLLKMNMTGRR